MRLSPYPPIPQDPEASRKPELGELASFLGRADPWYESTVNTLCPAILKLAEMVGAARREGREGGEGREEGREWREWKGEGRRSVIGRKEDGDILKSSEEEGGGVRRRAQLGMSAAPDLSQPHGISFSSHRGWALMSLGAVVTIPTPPFHRPGS